MTSEYIKEKQTKLEEDKQKKKLELISWNTGEAFLWLENDETLYLLAKKCKTWQRLKLMWGKYAPKRTVNTKLVNWQQVFKDIKEE
jgi:hypothetical protein